MISYKSMCNKTLTNIVMTILMAAVFLVTKSLLYLDFAENTTLTKIIEISSFIMMLPFFYRMVAEHLRKTEDIRRLNAYTTKLNHTLISQSHNPLFYEGDLNEGARILTRDVVENLGADRCSLWLYNEEKDAIELDMLYEDSTRRWSSGGKLEYADYTDYFNELIRNPVIIANDAEKHQATACFTESYLRPQGIKSMLDVPIIFRGETIGVICIESLTQRNWIDAEVNFAQVLSSIYSFAWSVSDGNDIKKNLLEIENFMDTAVLVSKTDEKGRMIYVNDKFTAVSGFTAQEVIGQDHKILASGVHNKDFWKEMYDTTINKRQIWNSVVTNRAKNGLFYYVDTYIKADFDPETGVLKGLTSIRQDITKIIESSIEIEKKNTYLEHASKILRHDMHSGINTYIPKGVSMLNMMLPKEIIKKYKLEAAVKLITEGLKHTQKVYKGVYEFTNLVKMDRVLEKQELNVHDILTSYLQSTIYKDSVVLLEDLPTIEVNESLFCTAIDNLIRNGLKYNDSPTRVVTIYKDSEGVIAIQDNGRGMTQEEFELYSKPYTRRVGQRETGSGLGLNICIAILKEHGFSVTCEKVEAGGSKIKIKYKEND
jgi:PAS domain S-box-containing protein